MKIEIVTGALSEKEANLQCKILIIGSLMWIAIPILYELGYI